MKVHWFGKTVRERGDYARKKEFVGVFECERKGLQRLALLLTANSETVRRCLSRAFRECIATSSVSREWVVSWTRRVVIRNAISLVMGAGDELSVRPTDESDNRFSEFSQDDSLSAIAETESILHLPDFDRLVFVICVLECYSVYDCALLLGRSPRDIDEARRRVGTQIGDAMNSAICHNVSRCSITAGPQRRYK